MPESETLPAETHADAALCLVGLIDGEPATVSLPRRGEVSIGRASEADVTVPHATVSRLHALVRLGGELTQSCEVEDLGSRNGTKVAGRAVAQGQRAVVRIGEVIEVGTVSFVLQVDYSHGARDSVRADTAATDSAMAAMHALADRIAAGDINVLLSGETGSGKEVLADRIHARSARAEKPFLRLNCAAMPEALLESELFGHERGAFTGAVTAKVGLLETACGGTVLLDEIGEMPPAVQAKLLRVIDEQRVLPVGGTKSRAIDVRFLSATHRDLAREIAEGRFRQDLYFRLAATTLRLPPLRLRLAELPGLAQLFANRSAQRAGRCPPRLSERALRRLLAHRWPGNVRELKNAVERAELLCRDGVIEAGDLELESQPPSQRAAELTSPSSIRKGSAGLIAFDASAAPSLRNELSEIERERILGALASCAGNQSGAARLLGMPRATLVKRLDTLGLPRPRKRPA